MFLKNKYTILYYKIIDKANEYERSKTEFYYEKHHIHPKSLGGSEVKKNLVLLTAREHFICHYLLTKMIEKHTHSYYKMLHAFILMKGSNPEQHRYMNGRLYESIKANYSEYRCMMTKGKKHSDEHKKNISNAMKGHSVSNDTKKILSDKASQRKRKPFSEEYKAKMSLLMKERHKLKNNKD